ncbi:MAG: NADH-quinone oxidoreductase subunit L [Actinobacteria bacterium]|nr:NADH-quinone oxidoreductase subunit L [Actinomycetota bacterium]
MSVSLLLLIIIGLPLTTFLIRVSIKKLLPYVHIFAIFSSTVSLVLSIYLALKTIVNGPFYWSTLWFEFGNNRIEVGYYLDALSSSMLVIVWLVSLAVQFYSLGYMFGDKRFSDYYALLSLFSFSMSGLVVSSSLATAFVFWELVGVCSFLLIGFWYERDSASRAAVKAFLTTRLGDTALLLGILVILYNFNSLDITAIGHSFGKFTQATSIAALLIFAGAVGKSAQFPLHVWLPDAMEGPTPVSALIHAATMVAAGVYLVARIQFLFVDSSVRAIVLAVGLVTAIIAALMATFQRDIKKVLAFSTISQLGYMMTALGAGAFAFGIYHLYTHAFFKALLFLSAGSIFHAIHSLDILDSGGMIKKLRWTGILFLIGALNLSGFPLTGGFFSKDSILYGLKESGFIWAYYGLLFGAFLTSFYIFKVFFRVFLGKPGKNFEEAHESPKVMLVPMLFLAVFSLAASLLSFSKPLGEFVYGHFDFSEALPSTIVSLLGIATAYVSYGLRKLELERFEVGAFKYVYEFFHNRMYIDDFYQAFFVRGYAILSKISSYVDTRIVDGLVNGVARSLTMIGRLIKPIESGFVQLYLFYTIVFLGILLTWLYLLGGKL